MHNNSNASKIDYKAIFESEKNVLIGHYNVFDGVEKIDVPIFKAYRSGGVKWQLIFDNSYIDHIDEDDYVCFPKHWLNLEGEKLCRVINEDYELYKASGKDKYILKHFKPSINDAVLCYKDDKDDEDNYALFKSKESAILAGKIAIFMDKYLKDKNKPDWID